MNIEIIEYEDHHQAIFKALNVVWLQQYNLLESHDLEILDHPDKYILKDGGAIYLARHGQEIVGSAALLKEQEGVYELVKMTVAPSHQKMGISNLLIEKCLHAARRLKAKQIVLFSNHQLKAALGLYEKYGFKHVPVKDSPFVTADVKMELML
jgi:putative acetyltransferase